MIKFFVQKGEALQERTIPLFEKDFFDRTGNWCAYTKGVTSTFDSEHQISYLLHSQAISTGSALGRPYEFVGQARNKSFIIWK